MAVLVDHVLYGLRVEQYGQGQVLGDGFVVFGEALEDFVGVGFAGGQGNAPFELDDLRAPQGVGQ